MKDASLACQKQGAAPTLVAPQHQARCRYPARSHLLSSTGIGRAYDRKPVEQALVRWGRAQKASDVHSVGLWEQPKQLITNEERSIARQLLDAL